MALTSMIVQPELHIATYPGPNRNDALVLHKSIPEPG